MMLFGPNNSSANSEFKIFQKHQNNPMDMSTHLGMYLHLKVLIICT